MQLNDIITILKDKNYNNAMIMARSLLNMPTADDKTIVDTILSNGLKSCGIPISESVTIEDCIKYLLETSELTPEQVQFVEALSVSEGIWDKIKSTVGLGSKPDIKSDIPTTGLFTNEELTKLKKDLMNWEVNKTFASPDEIYPLLKELAEYLGGDLGIKIAGYINQIGLIWDRYRQTKDENYKKKAKEMIKAITVPIYKILISRHKQVGGRTLKNSFEYKLSDRLKIFYE